jgi:glycosyltransferase involved in cell wall biosynthesis
MKVTVAVRTCSRPELFKEALASIHLQTHTDWEVIIFDDGASDLNFNIYKKFKDTHKDKRVLYVTLNEAWGLYKSSWIMAVDLAMGDIIVRLDDDDLLAEDALQFLSNTYEKNPELDFSYGSSLTFSDNAIGDVIETNTCFDHPKTHHEWAPYTVPNNNPWYHPWAFYRDYYTEARHFTSIIHCAKDNAFCTFHTYCMRTDSVKKVKDKINITSNCVDDLEMMGSLDYLGLGQASIKKVLTYVRIHNQGRITDSSNNQHMFNENFRIRDKVDELRPSGFLSRVIPLDAPDNLNSGVTNELKDKFSSYKQRILSILNS